MIIYSIIQKSQLEGASRLDAEYYQPEYLEKAKRLNAFSTVKLRNIAFITDGEHGSPIFDDESGIKYFSAQHVKDGYIDQASAKNISTIIDERNERSRLGENDILLSTVGTIGFAGLVTRDLLPANIDRHVARIVLREKRLDPEFLVAFLNSKYGKFQSIRQSTGNVQLNLFLSKIREFKIPRKNEPRISQLIRKALDKREASKSLYSQAENLFLRSLGLSTEVLVELERSDLSYVVNLSDVKSANRVDAEYFQPKYDKLIAKIKIKSKIHKLNELAVIKRGSLVDPVFYSDTEGTPYIRGKDFSSGSLEKTDLVYISEDFKPRNETKVKTGDVVFASIGSVGTSALVSRDFDNSFISNNIGKISIKNKNGILPEYLTVVFHSVIGKLQFEKEASQTAQPKISDSQVRNFYIPILPKLTQQKIANLVHKSHETRKKSKELLEEAKRKVEDMIEKGKKRRING